MGSRRARRSRGRVQPAISATKQKLQQPGISKLIKKSNRAQQKSAILSAARAARQAAQAESPLLIALLSVNNASDDELHSLASTMCATETDRTARPFETLIVSYGNGSSRDRLISALDAAKVADIVLLVWSGRTEMDLGVVELFDAMRAQGLPTVYAVAAGEGSDNADLRKLRGRQLAAESLGEDHMLRPIRFDLATGSDDAASINKMSLRRVLGKSPRVVSWRARYGYMRVEGASVEDAGNGVKVLSLCGWVRGRGFSANELIHVTGYGSFAAGRIIDVKSGEVISKRDVHGEPVESEAEVDGIMGEQTWPPEVDEVGEAEEGDDEDEGQKLAEVYDAAAEEDDRADGVADGAEDEDTMADMEDDDDRAQEEELDAMEEDEMSIDDEEVKRLRQAAKTDAEFPDEVDTPIDQPARVRFARYRGLKSLRTGEWDSKEQLPKEYAKLFQFRNLASTKKRVLQTAKKEAEQATGNPKSNFAVPGKKVYLHLLDVPQEDQSAIVQHLRAGSPLVAAGMLRHENRRSVVHFGVQRVDDEETGTDIKAKMHLEMHCGFVRFEGRPMFSENNANSDKHKMERFLKHGRFTVASFYGPAIFAPAPALLCHRGGGLIASGSALGADPDRIILKRIILTGYPFKTQKRRSVAKFMFFNPEDVRWFKPVELWSKLGRTGHILEPVGTHGHMKCIFDGVIQHHDTVCMTLYKRVYPKLVNQEDEHRQAMV